MSDREIQEATRQFWDGEAATFDNEPDHGLRDPKVHNAWRELLVQWLPQTPTTTPSKILDIGCGTGSLSLLMAALGNQVTGIDLSPAMIDQARAKALAAGAQIPPITFQVMDAANPQLVPQTFDGILCRHLLWALPEPAQVLQRWVKLLAPGGRLILIEGFWHTGAGLHAQEVVDALPSSWSNFVVQDLSANDALWGGEVSDERYMVIADSREHTKPVTATS